MKYNAPTGSVDLNAPFVGKNPALGIQGSRVPPKAVEEPQREIVDVITKAGLTPTGDVLQLDDAIAIKISAGGVTDIASARTVISGPVTAPPGSPVSGDEVLVADSPTGAFSGHARKLARYNGVSWSFTLNRPGRMFRVNNTDVYWTLHASSGWMAFTVPIAFVSGLQAAIDAKLSLSGGTMTGGMVLNNGVSVSAKNLAGNATFGAYGFFLLKAADDNVYFNNYEGSVIISRAAGAETIRFDAAGRVGINPSGTVLTPLDVNGATTLRGDVGGPTTGHAITMGANPIASGVGAGGFIQMRGSTASEPSRVVLGTANAARFQVGELGQMMIGTDAGVANKIFCSGGPSAPPAWKSIAELGFGVAIIGQIDNAPILDNQTSLVGTTIPVTARGGLSGVLTVVSVVQSGFAGNNTYMTYDVTFTAPQPDTSYAVLVNSQLVSVSNKTVAGFTITTHVCTVPGGLITPASPLTFQVVR